jgi:hypothetical protein
VESCSESIQALAHFGTGGLPNFREQALRTSKSAADILVTVPERAVVSWASYMSYIWVCGYDYSEWAG